MIEIPNSPAGAPASSPGSAAVPGGAGPSAGAAGDAAFQERQAAAAALVASGQMSQQQADAWLAPPGPVPAGQPGTATPAMIADITRCIADASPAEAQKLLGWEVEAGRLSKAQADGLLADRGAPESADGAAKAPADGKRSDADLLADGTKYDFGQLYDDASRTPQHLEMDKLGRMWLAEGGFDKNVGSFVAAEINRSGLAWSKMTPEGQELHRRTQEATLRKAWGAEYDSNLGLARQLVMELEQRRPGLIAVLDETGASNSPLVISSIYHRAREIAEKRGITWPPK